MSKSPSAWNAATVKSTCREPGSQPPQLSTTLTNTHLSEPLQTRSFCQRVHRDSEFSHRRSRKSKQEGLESQPFRVKAQAKDSSYDRQPAVRGVVGRLTVGAQVGSAQQLGFSRSWPVYQVILTSSECPDPRRPFQALLIVCTRVSAKLGLFPLFDAGDGSSASGSGSDALAASDAERERRKRGLETWTDSQPLFS